ncbi:CAP domain-containing protein [Nocardioides abyssi]|uniref:CAP domain-containing protein n=1 Tax=Nocardioides abyssi TaxID=3058370 RepID=A0ABT8EQM3_9ACTN|nr:CAP domain-containing protein [Nocardioides abyssi]MDN4160301.1 CAP domain-containing protein [Nocardioides abyssi]
MARLGTQLLATLLLGPALAAALLVVPAPAQAATPAQEYARAAFSTTNKVRAERDRGKLKNDACLRKAAARQAKLMAGQTTIFHQAIEALLDGCTLEMVGENVAYGYATGKAVVRKGWMKSPGHRANILRKGYTRMGIAARKSQDGTWYVAQVFGRPVG